MTNIDTETQLLERSAFSVPEFCLRNGISVSTYMRLKNTGYGPAEMRLGTAIRITTKSEAEWQEARSHPKGEEADTVRKAIQKLRARGRKAGAAAIQSPKHVSKRKRA